MSLILNDYQHLLPFEIACKIGSYINKGQDGIVYYFDQDKVIKICQFDTDNIFNYCDLEKVLEYLSNHKEDVYAYVYKYDFIGNINNNQVYYYITDKLNQITEDEWKVFHSIISHEDRNIVKNYSKEKLEKILFGLSHGLDFDVKRVKFFYEALKKSKIKHLDLHPRNIMKDNSGDFKLVDFSRITMEII